MKMEPMCDITLCSADNKLFKVHSKIISASSRYLKEKLTHVQYTGTLKLQYVKADALEVTIAFIYGTSPKTMSHLKLLQNGAKELVVHEAMEFCRNEVTELMQYYQLDKPCEKACIIHEYNPPDLSDNCRENNTCSPKRKNERILDPGDPYIEPGDPYVEPNDPCIVNAERTVKLDNDRIDNVVHETSSQNVVNTNNAPGQNHAIDNWENESTLSNNPKMSPDCNNSEVQEKNRYELNMFGDEFVDSDHLWISPEEIRKLLDDSEVQSGSGQFEIKCKDVNNNHLLHSKPCIPTYIEEDDQDVQLETYTGPFDKTIAEIIPIDRGNSTGKPPYTDLSKREQDCTLEASSRQTLRSTENKQDKSRICEECGELFATLPLFITHKLKVHQKGELFPCTYCTYKTPRKKDFINHVLSRHGVVPPNTKIFSCTKCSYRCADRSRFNEHESRHFNTKDFQCDSCSKMFTTKRGLKNHLMYHNDKFPYECDQCSASFKVGSKLREHVRLVHSQKGEKPFKCGYCDFHASIRGNVNQHIKRVHKVSNIKVIDTKAEKRRFVKKYFYEDFTGNDIKSKSLFPS